MKKRFLLLPTALLVLAGCSSGSSAPIENAEGNLSPGIMQPVESTSGSGTWQPTIQQQSMPDSMNQPVNTTSTTVPPQTQPQPVLQEVQAQSAANPVQQANQTVPQQMTGTVQKARPQTQDIDIPRNPNTNAPDYSRIDKGSYKACKYQVRKGDTMFLIAYIAGLDVKELAALNNMSEPYNLKIGQSVNVSSCDETVTTTETVAAAAPVKPAQPEVTYTSAANGTQYGSDGSITGPVKASAGAAGNAPAAGAASGGVVAGMGTASSAPGRTVTAPVASNIAWQWPTAGKIIQQFSSSDGGNKGIDISGSRGQAVNAAAAGTVVYAGNALRGYGNLIIIKHNDDFLSAYAHNESILVKDQQTVKAGQQIAKMGNSGTNSVKLHFEIRYKGKSVNPVSYLPRR